jgi:hypothetical protein
VETSKPKSAEVSKEENAETPKADRNAETPNPSEPAAHRGSCATSASASQAGLPTDPQAFWMATEDLATLVPPTDIPAAPALKIAGPPPFPRGRFPVMGFLATVYEQVSAKAREMGAADETAGSK